MVYVNGGQFVPVSMCLKCQGRNKMATPLQTTFRMHFHFFEIDIIDFIQNVVIESLLKIRYHWCR